MVSKKILKRIHASFGGAGLAAILYSLFVMVLLYMDVNFYELPAWAHDFALPGSIFVNVDPIGGLLLGVPFTVILTSLLIYMSIGYITDWLYDPYK